MTAKVLLPSNNPLLSLKALPAFGFLAICLCFPDIAAASGGITEFSSPLESVVNTITGPAGKWISIVAMALCGVIFIMNNDENNAFLPSYKIHFILTNHIIIRKLFPIIIRLNPVKSEPRAGRLAGIFLLSILPG